MQERHKGNSRANAEVEIPRPPWAAAQYSNQSRLKQDNNSSRKNNESEPKR